MATAGDSLNRNINKLLNRIAIRAETNPQEVLHRTFVEVEQISSGLLRLDHQVMYGRRGTGKTHALSNLAVRLDAEGDVPVYIDLRKIGSNNGLYSDYHQPLSLRASQLLIDIIEAIHLELLTKSIEDERFETMFPKLDDIVEAATEIRVEGPVSLVAEEEREKSRDDSTGWRAEARAREPDVTIGLEHSHRSSGKKRVRTQIKRSGAELPRLLFGPLGRALDAAAQSIYPHRIWILFDEWSGIPIDLQPLVADMLRRTVFPSQGFTVKIAAVERRSRFIQRADASTYVGLELGSDTAAALNLDEYLLAIEAGARARSFFAQLLSRHIMVLAEDLGVSLPTSAPAHFLSAAFEEHAFAELVRAAEGVPRDALNIAGLAAISAGNQKIRVGNVKAAARKYYLQDKETGITGNTVAQDMWFRLQREVVVERRSRTFLVRRNRDHTNPAILDLYDARLIHLLKPGLGRPSRPGVGFDGYSVDYGSYVHLMDEEQANAMWDARSRPWEYSRDEAFLPDRFDESVIFTPARPRESRSRRGRKMRELGVGRPTAVDDVDDQEAYDDDDGRRSRLSLAIYDPSVNVGTVCGQLVRLLLSWSFTFASATVRWPVAYKTWLGCPGASFTWASRFGQSSGIRLPRARWCWPWVSVRWS